MSPATRKYLSRNRPRPCDRCRQQKLRCQTDGQNACQRCKRSNVSCTFSGKAGRGPPATSPSSGQGQSPVAEFPNPTNTQVPLSTSAPEGTSTILPVVAPVSAEGHGQGAQRDEQWPSMTTPIAPLFPAQGLSTQISQSLDKVEGHYYQLCGGSSDGDPWLLRHCRYDELGFRKFCKMHIRNVGGVPTRDKIPAHFMVIEDALCDASRAETRVNEYGDLREELSRHVPSHYGQRLIRLFMKRVFPTLPIISRTELGLSQGEDIPGAHVLDKIPTCLLAAIYGSAIPFASEDDHLSLFIIYEKPRVARIWRIVYEIILEEIHRPRLSVLQASLLYIHRQTKDEQSYAVADTAFAWSFMGMVVGLAHSLGLNLECRLFGIPTQEKRIRRRLWWAVYIEDKWMSLLSGRPPYIRPGEWDVVELSDDDFLPPLYSYVSLPDAKSPFRDMAHLATIAEKVQESLYSLRASQLLAEDMAASIEAAKPLFHRLSVWRESVTIPTGPHLAHDTLDNTQSPCPATIYNAYLTLVVCVWRALLRTTVRSSEPPQIIHVEDPLEGSNSFLEDHDWNFSHLPEMDLRLDDGRVEDSTVVKELYEAAISCASTVVDFVSSLPSAAFSEFWYSWSRTGFVLVLNFLMLLLVQAPDFEKATRVKNLIGKWRQALDHQSKAFPMLILAKVRLGSYFWVGLEEAFHLPPHVQQALQQSA